MSETILRRFLDATWNRHDADALAGWLAPDFVYHPARGPDRSAAEYATMARGFLAAFPDLRFTILDAIERDGLVSVRLRIEGTQRGAWRDRAPTGGRIDVQGRPWFRFRDGKLVEVWPLWDEAGAMEQLDRAATLK